MLDWGDVIMSDHYRLNFSFGIDPYGPPQWVEVFKSLARNEKPNTRDLKTLPLMLRDFLASPDMLGFGDPRPFSDGDASGRLGSPVFLSFRGESQESAYWPKSPEWEVQFSISMHDDWYGNGAYLMWMLMVDIVGENGLYATLFTENQKSALEHFYKEQGDIIQVRLDAPNTGRWVPPQFPKSLAEVSPSFRPAEPSAGGIKSVLRSTPEQRSEAAAEVEAMFRAEGWSGDED